MTSTPTIATIREALLQARADLDDALDLLDEVDELPAEVAERVSGAVDALAEALGEMANNADAARTVADVEPDGGSGLGDGADRRPPFSRVSPRVRGANSGTHFRLAGGHQFGEDDRAAPIFPSAFSERVDPAPAWVWGRLIMCRSKGG
jgi:hypothetical protein